jgi:hypothetical protein
MSLLLEIPGMLEGLAMISIRGARACHVTVLAMSLNGCSFIFVDTPPASPPRYGSETKVRCTTSKAAPIIDTVIASYQVVRTGVAVSSDESDYANAPISRGADIGFGVGLAALFLGSAIYGYVQTGRCNAMQGGAPAERGLPDKEDEAWREPPGPTAAPSSAPPPGGSVPPSVESGVGPTGAGQNAPGAPTSSAPAPAAQPAPVPAPPAKSFPDAR